MSKKYDVFISYRRDTSTEMARLIDSSVDRTWYNSFLDYNELKDSKWGPQLMAAIDAAPVFLFILSPGALDRCSEDGDWVRSEISYALSKNKHIVPVNPDDAFKDSDFPDDLPDDIRAALSENQHSDIRLGQLFKSSIDKMIKERIAPYCPRVIMLKRILYAATAAISVFAAVISVMLIMASVKLSDDLKEYDQNYDKIQNVYDLKDLNSEVVSCFEKADSLRSLYDLTRNSVKFRDLKDIHHRLYNLASNEFCAAFKEYTNGNQDITDEYISYYDSLVSRLDPEKKRQVFNSKK